MKRLLLVVACIVAVAVFVAGWSATRKQEATIKAQGTCPEDVLACARAVAPTWSKPVELRELQAYEFAHSLVVPDAAPRPVPFDFEAAQAASREGKSVAQQYFEHLCRTESALVVPRRQENVDGFLIMRPRKQVDSMPADSDRYGVEEPTGIGWFQDPVTEPAEPLDWVASGFVQPLFGLYEFVELPRADGKVTRVERSTTPDPGYPHGIDSNWAPVGDIPYVARRVVHEDSLSRFGYTWRGIRRPGDRELGIAGGEFFIVDLETAQVLGFLRTFNSTFAPRRPSFTRWSAARECTDLRSAMTLRSLVWHTLPPRLEVNDEFVPPELVSEYHAHVKKITGNNDAH